MGTLVRGEGGDGKGRGRRVFLFGIERLITKVKKKPKKGRFRRELEKGMGISGGAMFMYSENKGFSGRHFIARKYGYWSLRAGEFNKEWCRFFKM